MSSIVLRVVEDLMLQTPLASVISTTYREDHEDQDDGPHQSYLVVHADDVEISE